MGCRSMFEKRFQLKAHGTDIKTEVIAGITTFLTMAYIIVINPNMLAAAGMDYGAVFTATCIAAAVGSLIMGLLANYPIALAPGMGINAYFAFVVVGTMGHDWRVALAAVFLSGCIFLLLSLFKVREWIVNSIPQSLRFGISAGIGFFLALIALKNVGIIVANPATLVSLGNLLAPSSLLTFLGFFIICALAYRKVTGAVMIGIVVVTLISLVLGMTQYQGVLAAPPSMMPTFMEMDLAAVLDVSLISIVFTFLFVDLFDTSGTLIAAAHRGNLLDKTGRLPRLKRALMADSVATMTGAVLGTSTTTSYIESTAGISAGGRTGLTAVVVAILFLLSLFFAPIISIVPAYATAGALLYVSVLMAGGLAHIDWDDITEAAPGVVTALTMAFTFSIANGIAIGFITYAAIKLCSGRLRDLNISIITIALLFVAKFVFL
jgi:AGZA family xanthine/uracil permease-like MFS transporter